MKVDPHSRWKIWKDCTLRWREWNGEFVVYNTGSGDTHLLDELSGNTLKAIEESPATLLSLSSRWDDKSTDANREVVDHLTELLPNLHKLRLIEPLKKCE
jgi:PqqD family protein of HPr-rel-A system